MRATARVAATWRACCLLGSRPRRPQEGSAAAAGGWVREGAAVQSSPPLTREQAPITGAAAAYAYARELSQSTDDVHAACELHVHMARSGWHAAPPPVNRWRRQGGRNCIAIRCVVLFSWHSQHPCACHVRCVCVRDAMRLAPGGVVGTAYLGPLGWVRAPPKPTIASQYHCWWK